MSQASPSPVSSQAHQAEPAQAREIGLPGQDVLVRGSGGDDDDVIILPVPALAVAQGQADGDRRARRGPVDGLERGREKAQPAGSQQPVGNILDLWGDAEPVDIPEGTDMAHDPCRSGSGKGTPDMSGLRPQRIEDGLPGDTVPGGFGHRGPHPADQFAGCGRRPAGKIAPGRLDDRGMAAGPQAAPGKDRDRPGMAGLVERGDDIADVRPSRRSEPVAGLDGRQGTGPGRIGDQARIAGKRGECLGRARGRMAGGDHHDVAAMAAAAERGHDILALLVADGFDGAADMADRTRHDKGPDGIIDIMAEGLAPGIKTPVGSQRPRGRGRARRSGKNRSRKPPRHPDRGSSGPPAR